MEREDWQHRLLGCGAEQLSAPGAPSHRAAGSLASTLEPEEAGYSSLAPVPLAERHTGKCRPGPCSLACQGEPSGGRQVRGSPGMYRSWAATALQAEGTGLERGRMVSQLEAEFPLGCVAP